MIYLGDVCLMKDEVENPSHYTQGPVEFIEAVESRGWGKVWALGNALKYLWRAGEKGDEETDLRKARWYIDRRLHQIACEREMGAIEAEDHDVFNF